MAQVQALPYQAGNLCRRNPNQAAETIRGSRAPPAVHMLSCRGGSCDLPTSFSSWLEREVARLDDSPKSGNHISSRMGIEYNTPQSRTRQQQQHKLQGPLGESGRMQIGTAVEHAHLQAHNNAAFCDTMKWSREYLNLLSVYQILIAHGLRHSQQACPTSSAGRMRDINKGEGNKMGFSTVNSNRWIACMSPLKTE